MRSLRTTRRIASTIAIATVALLLVASRAEAQTAIAAQPTRILGSITITGTPADSHRAPAHNPIEDLPLTSDEAAAELERTTPRTEQPDHGAMLAGVAILCLTYFPTAAIGLISGADNISLVIPVAGPAVDAIMLLGNGSHGLEGIATMLFTDSLIQGLALALWITGGSNHATDARESHHSARLDWRLLPGAAGAPLGVTLTAIAF